MNPNTGSSRRHGDLLQKLAKAFSSGVQKDPASLFQARETVALLAQKVREEEGQESQGVFVVLEALLQHMLNDRPIASAGAGQMAAELVNYISSLMDVPATRRQSVNSAKQAVSSVTGLLGASRPAARDLTFRSSTDERIGELLLRKGSIDRKQLNQAIIAQKFSHKLLGEILVDIDAITTETLYAALEEQRESAGGVRMRRVERA